MLERGFRIRQVFEYVQHQDQIELLNRLEGVIKFLQEDSRTMRAVGSDGVMVGFNTINFTEAAKTIKQEAVTTAHIEDAQGAIGREAEALNFIQNGLLPRPPPPMLLIKNPVLLCVVALHMDTCLLWPGVLRGELRNIRCGQADTAAAV